jgi:hypothetical protein
MRMKRDLGLSTSHRCKSERDQIRYWGNNRFDECQFVRNLEYDIFAHKTGRNSR